MIIFVMYYILAPIFKEQTDELIGAFHTLAITEIKE